MSLSKIRIHIGKGEDRIDLSVKQAGQIIVIFALMLTVLIGLVGIAIDVTYAWRSGLQIQRAADAAAMAGVVYLPGNTPAGETKADLIATTNGYCPSITFCTAPNATVAAAPPASDPRKMLVTITAQAPTFFVRLFGINSWTISRTAEAAYQLPLPLGSPLTYMGVGCFVLAPGNQTPVPGCASTGNGQSGITSDGSTFTTTNFADIGSLGAWGAISAPGGDSSNGDAYAPKNDANSTVSGVTKNVMYPASNPGPGADGYKGYFYEINIPANDAAGTIQIFDPGFCAMGAGTAGNYGAGDHWVGSSADSSHPISTYYNLFNTNNQPLLGPSSWTYLNISSGTLFQNEYSSDTANGGPNSGKACSSTGVVNGSDNFHDKWWTFASGLAAGTYEVEVSTTNVSITQTANGPSWAVVSETSDGTGAQNMFAIQASATGTGGAPTVHGYDRMAVYNNLAANNVVQQFYIAQVDQQSGAGKTLTIDLFDIGDSTAGYIKILNPDGGAQTAATFNYTTFNYNSTLTRVSPGNCVAKSYSACQGTGVSQITVAGANGSSFNNTWIEITIPLLSTYGTTLWNNGWWQVQYTVSAGSDLTTWSVNVNGNPVHLVSLIG